MLRQHVCCDIQKALLLRLESAGKHLLCLLDARCTLSANSFFEGKLAPHCQLKALHVPKHSDTYLASYEFCSTHLPAASLTLPGCLQGDALCGSGAQGSAL